MSTTSKAMTLQEAKDKIAIKHGWSGWHTLVSYHREANIEGEVHEDYLDEVAELYHSSQSAALKDETIQEVIDLFKPLFEIEPKQQNLVQIALKLKEVYGQIESLKIDLKG